MAEPSLTIYGTDGVHNPPTGRGFQSFRGDVTANEVKLPYLNPQTHERAIGVVTKPGKGSVNKKEHGASSRRNGLGRERRGHLAP